jgi:transmembrane sensor
MNLNHINTIDDLISNDSFKRWILEKNEEDAKFWNHWLQEHPDELELVATAKVLIVSIIDTDEVPGEQIEEQVSILRHAMQAYDRKSIKNERKNTIHKRIFIGSKRKVVQLFFGKNQWWKVAALLLIICGSYVIYSRSLSTKNILYKYEVFLTETSNQGIEYKNNDDSARKIVLSDGSEVILEVNSKLICAKNFNAGKREVFLTGEAFFKVAKNPERPFIVYSKNIITKVLGTSFWIKSITDKKVCVIVRTGKVSIFRPKNFKEADAGSPVLSGTVLTPNQQVVYDVENDQMNKSLVNAPKSFDMVSPDSFVFDATPAVQVFKKLQDAYGINILIDEETLASCSVSASLGDESFYEKLAMICKIIHADFQTIDGNVIINSKGCK